MSDDTVQKPMWVRLFFFGISFSASILLTLAFAEAMLRLFPGLLPVELQRIIRADPGDYGVDHSYIGHLHKQNSALVISGGDFRAVHHTDGYGFRNAWPWPNTAEIVILGDSVTFGQGVEDEEAWPAILARSFPASRVINLGLIGAGPQQYLRVYKTFGLKLRPKVLLVGFFMGNDFWDAGMFDWWLRMGAAGNYMVWRDFGAPTRVSVDLQQPIRNIVSSLVWRAKFFARKSYLYNLLRFVKANLNELTPSAKTVFHASDGSRLELAPSVLANHTKSARPGNRVFQLALDSLQQIHSLAKENGATVLVILQRSKEEVYLPLVGESPTDSAAPLRAALNNLGIPYLDLLDGFRSRAAKGEVLFFETDGHPNAHGYVLIAELVTFHLKQHAKEYGL